MKKVYMSDKIGEEYKKWRPDFPQFKNVLIPRELPNSLVDVAEQILEGRKRGADTKELEQKAERLVYSAYGLSPEEIDLVNRTTDWKES